MTNISEDKKRQIYNKIYNIYLSKNFTYNASNEFNVEGTIFTRQEIGDKAKFYVDNYATDEEKDIYADCRKKRDSSIDFNYVKQLETIYKAFLLAKDLRNYSRQSFIKASCYNDLYAHQNEKITFTKQYYRYIDLNYIVKDKGESFLNLLFQCHDEQTFKMRLESYNIPIDSVEKCIEQYVKVYATFPEQSQYYKFIEESKAKPKEAKIPKELPVYVSLFNDILFIFLNSNLTTEEKQKEIYAAIDKSHLIVNFLKSNISNYIVNYCKGFTYAEQKDINNDLYYILSGYTRYLQQIKKQKEFQKTNACFHPNLDFARDFVLNFAYSDIYNSVEIYCDRYNKTVEAFQICLDLLKEQDFESYSIYEALKINKDKKIVKQVIEKIKGFLAAPTDIIDYYLQVGIPLDSLNSIAKKYLNDSQKRAVDIFIKQNKAPLLKDKDTSSIFSCAYTISKHDKNGKVIEGTRHLVTDEEKDLLIDYLTNNHIPLTAKTFSVLMRRWYDETINIEEKGISLTRKK